MNDFINHHPKNKKRSEISLLPFEQYSINLYIYIKPKLLKLPQFSTSA